MAVTLPGCGVKIVSRDQSAAAAKTNVDAAEVEHGIEIPFCGSPGIISHRFLNVGDCGAACFIASADNEAGIHIAIVSHTKQLRQNGTKLYDGGRTVAAAHGGCRQKTVGAVYLPGFLPLDKSPHGFVNIAAVQKGFSLTIQIHIRSF